MRTKCFNPQMWDEDRDLNTWGGARGHLATEHVAALVGANPQLWSGLHQGSMGPVQGSEGSLGPNEAEMGRCGRDRGAEDQKAVKPEDETKEAVMVCLGPQSGPRTDRQAPENGGQQCCRAWGHSQLARCSVFSSDTRKLFFPTCNAR